MRGKTEIKPKNNTTGTGQKISWKRNLSGWLLILPTLIFFIFLVWRPIIIGACYSFFKLEGFTPTEFVGLKNFKDVISDTNFIQTVFNTLKYVFWSLIIGYLLPLITAIFLNEATYGKSFFRTSFYLPAIIPAMATYMIWRVIFGDGGTGLLNMILNHFGVENANWLGNKELVIPLIITTMTWSGFGSTAVFYLASLQSVNNELYEAARIDGCKLFGRIRYVLIPHMRGIMLLSLVRQIMAVFNVTEQPLAMTGGGPNGASLSLGLTNYFYAFKYGQYDKALAVGVITFCMLSVLTIFYFKLDKKINED